MPVRFPRAPAAALRSLFALLMLAPSLAAAQYSPILDKAPAPWKAYFDAARRADALAAPLERCLAYPDFPGNAWPAGLAQAYCHSLHDPALTLADIAAHLERGDAMGLEYLMRAALAAHGAPGHSETIHRVLAAFGAQGQADTLSARWLQLAPDSPFALAARAQYLLNLVWEGGAEAGATAAPAAEAAALLERAIRREPKLVAAHALLLELGMVSGNQTMLDSAWKRGLAADPGCRQLARVRMQSLRPRWGGSVEAMDGFAAQLSAQAARRPLLHNVAAMAALERAIGLLQRSRSAEAVQVLRPAAATSTYPDIWWRLGLELGEIEGVDRFEMLATLIESGRFVDDDYAAAYERGRQLMHAGEAEWAIRVLEHARSLNPAKLNVRQVLGAVYVQAGRPQEAEAHFVAALDAPDLRALTLRALVASMNKSPHPERAARYAEMLTREQPESPHGWSVLGQARYALQDWAGARAAYESFLRVADRQAPAWRNTIAFIEKRLAELKARKP